MESISYKLAVLLALAVPDLGSAQATGQVIRAGDWAVYQSSGIELILDGQHLALGPSCVAETGVTGGSVRFIVPAPSQGPEVRGFTVGAILADSWMHTEHSGELTLGKEQFEVVLENAFYEGNGITFWMPPERSLSTTMQVAAGHFDPVVDVTDDRGQRIARFSSRGLQEALSELNRCGAVPTN